MQAELIEQKDGAMLRGGGTHSCCRYFFRDFAVCAQKNKARFTSPLASQTKVKEDHLNAGYTYLPPTPLH